MFCLTVLVLVEVVVGVSLLSSSS